MGARTQTSAAGAIALLTEPEPVLKEHAIRALVPMVPQFWAEISEQIPLMSVLYHSAIANELNSSLTEKRSTKAAKSPRRHETQQLFLPARCIISWESTMRRCRLLLVPGQRSRMKHTSLVQRNMSRLSSVRVYLFCTSLFPLC